MWLALRIALRVAAAAVCCSGAVCAQSDGSFVGKTIIIYVTNPPGGGFDLNARLLARHLGDHIPGHPTVIVANMPGAHGVTGANYLYNVAPKDGSALAAPVPYIAQYQVQGIGGLQYDAAKFAWIGSIGPLNEIMYVWHTVPVQSIADLKSRETIFAGNGAVETFARLLSAVAGSRLKLVKGYTGTKEAHLALERGEVEGAVSALSTLRANWPDWLATNKVRILLNNDFKRNSEIPDVPASIELAQTPTDRDLVSFFIRGSSIGWAFIAPPGVSPEIQAILRQGFSDTMKDPAFVDDIHQSKFDVEPKTGTELQDIVDGMVGVSAETKAKIQEIAGSEL
jgi:tripartite-type tricarboxylate transporter receptor subunit TctC